MAVSPGSQAEYLPELCAGLILAAVAGEAVDGSSYMECMDLIEVCSILLS